jgi:GntR family transcriptional regulator
MLDSVSYTENGQPIEYYHAVHRGDRSRFEVELVRIREQNQVGAEDTASINDHPLESFENTHHR